MVRGIAELHAEIQYLKEMLCVEESEIQNLEGNAESDMKYPSSPREVKRLRKDNMALRKKLERLRRAEKNLANDPQILDKRNAVTAVWKEVSSIQKEVDTLECVRHHWRRGMEEARAHERSVSAIRGLQSEEQIALRDELRDLTEELKAADRLDTQLHERFAVLQQQHLLNVQEEEVSRLKKKCAQQNQLIEMLREKANTSKSRRVDLMDENRQLVFKEGRAKAKMEREIADLQNLLLQREEELRQFYMAAGRLRSR